MKHIVAINASPRVKWNTAMLVDEAARGAQEAGAEIIHFDLYKLERFTACISCFGCKRAPNEGKCVYKDGLKPVLDAIREADGLIIGTPNYLGDVSAVFRSLFERLVFQSLTYKKEPRRYDNPFIHVLMIMTSNSPKAMYAIGDQAMMINRYKGTLSGMVGPTKVMIAGDTLQVSDYSRYDWTMFDPAAKQKRREEVFPKEKEKAFELGRTLVEAPWQKYTQEREGAA